MTPPTTTSAPVAIDVHLSPADIEEALRADVLAGLTATPKELPPKWFYDDKGCELFDEITRLPEYYPTEAEREILLREAPAIAVASAADTMIELGSGTSDKTRALIDAFQATGQLKRFVAFEVNETTLRSAANTLAIEYGDIEVHGVVGDFAHHLDQLPRGGTRMIAFLGGTIGNLDPAERKAFFADLVGQMSPGDSLLLGTDLVKDVGRLERAYDDASGVTAAFNLNVLDVINGALDADFDPAAFEHVARYDTDADRIEMLLRSTTAQSVSVAALDLQVDFAVGEEMRTEISSKFTKERIATELADAGLRQAGWWTDAAGDFGVSLAVRS